MMRIGEAASGSAVGKAINPFRTTFCTLTALENMTKAEKKTESKG